MQIHRWYSSLYYFREVTVICGLINQFMHINQFTPWSKSMKCYLGGGGGGGGLAILIEF